MSKTAKQHLAAIRRHAAAKAKAAQLLTEAMREAVAEGVPSADVAEAAGVSKGRVSQVAPREKAVQTPVHAQKNDGAASCGTVPVLPPDTVATLSGYASTRKRTPYGRGTAFYDVASGVLVTEQGERFAPVTGQVGSVAHVLAMVTVAGQTRQVGRVYLTGPAPIDAESGATVAEQTRAWALAHPGEGWEVAGQGHYLAHADLPVCRFVNASGCRVTIMRAASWWGETDAAPEVAAAAWRGLGLVLDSVPVFSGAGLADTPATTGRALWLRTIPEGKAYPVLSDEYRGLIAATSGQGRIELRPCPPKRPATGQGFTYLDGRLMYGALTWGMPVGEPVRWTGAQVDGLDAAAMERTLRGRGRWRITCTVPEGWAHVGMFMAPGDGGRWVYPDRPGQVFTTWADGAEVWAAMAQGWEPVIHEGITWDEGKPLDTWTKHLTDVWAKAKAAEAAGNEAAGLAAKAVRSIMLYAIGAFASRTHNTTGATPADTPEAVPADVVPGSVRRVGDLLTWERPGAINAWQAETAHPEWSATVWARARARLLTGRGVDGEPVGALHLAPEQIIGMATDALYVAGPVPTWADDGKPGRFRVKGHRAGAFTWPSTYTDLWRLRDEAEAGA